MNCIQKFIGQYSSICYLCNINGVYMSDEVVGIIINCVFSYKKQIIVGDIVEDFVGEFMFVLLLFMSVY